VRGTGIGAGKPAGVASLAWHFVVDKTDVAA